MITQCRFSAAIHFFKKGFFERWNLHEYKDTSAPCLFFGVYTTGDLDAVNNHKGLKVVWFAGADMPNAARLNKDCIIVNWHHWLHVIEKYNPVCRIIPQNITYRDFKDYKPTPLGDRIYCYQNAPNEMNRKKYRFDILEPLLKKYGTRIIIGYHGHTEKQMIEIYRNSFINLQFNPTSGFGSTLEMAHMGRPSISNEKTEFCLNYSGFDDICRIIETVKPDIEKVSESARTFVMPTDWQNEKQYD